jgi:hypothetical protein
MTTTETRSNIGRFAVIAYKGKCYTGNVLDLVAGTSRPKRIRIQNDPFLQGTVVMPSEYQFKEWAPLDD